MTNVQKFLSNHGLAAGDIDADVLIAEFLAEMEGGLAGRESSLAMIPAYVSADREIPVSEPIIVIDAGGTNLRVACISFDADYRPHIDGYSIYPMPGAGEAVSADDFFRQLAGYLGPVLAKSNRIGFCFSYPAEINQEMDGRLIRWTKEIRAPQVIGQFIGRGLLEALGSAGAGKSIVLLNDTVATLLAGKAARKKPYGSYVGFILGTGTNIAYLERNQNILKVNHFDPSGSQAVNVESGDFSGAPGGDIDRLLDQESEDHGSHRFEKMISGRYLPRIALGALKEGAREGLFTDACGLWINGLEKLDHGQMGTLIHNGGAGISESTAFSETDSRIIRTTVKAIIERAAKLAAVNITAAVVKAACENTELPVCIDIDGSTYYKAAGLRGHTEAYLRKMLGERNIPYALVHVDRAPIIGAAIAGLVN